MAEPELRAVVATRKAFRTLVHAPSGTALDEKGAGLWPADSFTFRLIQEKALRYAADPSVDDVDEDAITANPPPIPTPAVAEKGK